MLIIVRDCKEERVETIEGTKELEGKREVEAISRQPAYPVFAFESLLSGEENQAENRMKAQRRERVVAV